MRINFKAIIAIAFAVVVAVAGFNALQVQTYSGSDLSFTMSGGPVTIINNAEDNGSALMTTTGTSGTFGIRGSHLNTAETSTREGTGRTAVNSITVPLAPGETTIQLTRGSNVQVALSGSDSFNVTAAPMNDTSARDTVIFVAVVVLAAVGYALFQLRDTLRNLFSPAERRARLEAEMTAST